MQTRDERLAQLGATPRILAHLVAEVPEERFDAMIDGEWSPRTLIAHLRDDEVLCQRLALSRMLAEQHPELRFMDGADWEPGRSRTRDRKEELLADFALQRQASLNTLRLLRPEDWARTGSTAEGDLTIDQLVAAWVRHDREHIAQLERAVGETLTQVLERRREHPPTG